MKSWRAILAALLGLAFPAAADLTAHLRTTKAGEYRVTYWTSEQGLPQNTVTCLLQTRDGYLWFGTRFGLVRHDGVRFQSFISDLPLADADGADVRGLAEDAEGRLWLQSGAGLASYHRGRFQFYPLKDAPFPGTIQSFCISRSGGLWVAKRRGIVQVAEGHVTRTWDLEKDLGWNRPDSHVGLGRISEDAAGRLWVQASDLYWSAWRRLDPRTGAVEDVTNLLASAVTDISALLEDRRGRLWLARPHELLCGENGRWTRFAVTNAWAGHKVRQLAEDREGRLWAVSRGPVQLHRFADGQFTSYGVASGLANADDLRFVMPDQEGNVWVGSGSGGLNRLQPRPLVSMLTGSFSTMDEVYSVAPGRDGRVWMATSYGLVEYHHDRFTVHTNAAVPDAAGNFPRVRPVLEDSSGTVWAGLDEKGLRTLRGEELVSAATPILPGNGKRIVTSLFEDRDGTLWIGTPRGLLESRGGEHRLWTTNDGLSDNSVFGLVEGPDGSLWIGTQQGGINRIKDGRARSYATGDGLLSQNAWPLRAEPDGTVWVGTPVGLNRIRSGEIRAVTMREGLFDSLAYCLLEDRRSNYWTFGNRGIWRMKQADLDAVADGRASRVLCVSYGEADGMASPEGNGDWQPNAASLPNGELWFPTTRGVVTLDPEKLRDHTVPPVVVIEEVRVDEETVFKDGGLAGKSDIRHPKSHLLTATVGESPLRLAPGRARVLEIRYTANTFVDAEKARFRFRLEGHDRDWREADARRTAFYTNLRPGSFRFQVMACNLHGYWSRVPAEFPFALAPHFFETWPFLVLCAGAVVAGVGGWHFRRLRRRRRMLHLRQQQALEEERSRIAKDLHDDLGANFTGLALQLDVARRAQADPTALMQHLEAIAQSIRTLVDRMREVVWTVNPHCDTLESFSAYLCQYAETFLAAAGLRCRLDLPAELPAHALSAEARHHLLMVAKEALNNAAKHAVATEVRLGLNLAGGDLLLTIADNGRGFAPRPHADAGAASRTSNAHGTGHGLANIRRRVEVLGGGVEIEGKLGLGTKILVRVPLQRERRHLKP